MKKEQDMSTGIEWTHVPGFKGETWNPVTGCSKVSAGCKHCYAEREFPRLVGNPKLKAYPAGRKFTDVMCHPERLGIPLRWRKKPRWVFVNSMSDLFHEDVPDEFIDWVFGTIALCQQHVFMVLTKRPGRMRGWFTERSGKRATVGHSYEVEWPLPNVWLGVSVEDQETAAERIPLLLETPAAVRFVSYEPALGPVDFTKVEYTARLREMLYGAMRFEGKFDAEAERIAKENTEGGHAYLNVLTGDWFDGWDSGDGHKKLDWVICGGESGPDARPMHPDWARSARDQCEAARHGASATSVPFFFRQWGELVPGNPQELVERDGKMIPSWTTYANGTLTPEHDVVMEDGCPFLRVGKKAAGAMLDGKEWKQFPDRVGQADPSVRAGAPRDDKAVKA